MNGSRHNEAVHLLTQLVSCPSPSGAEAALQELMADWLRDNGLSPQLERTPEGLTNLVVTVSGNRPGPHLLLLGHADTVEPQQGWTRDPFAAQVEEGRLYGVGAMDMKAGLTAALLALRELAAERDWSGTVTFASVADEENASRGAKALLHTRNDFDAALVCEPHFEDVVIGAVGKINVRVTCHGKSAHGSRPRDGVNAVDELARLLALLADVPFSRHELLGEATRCVLNFQGGPAEYQIQVPDRATCLINWHLTPAETPASAVALIESLVSELDSEATFDIEVLEPAYPSYLTQEDDPFVRRFSTLYKRQFGRSPVLSYGRGVSDANLVAAAGIPVLMFGPGGANMHGADEWSDTSQIPAAAELYVNLVRDAQPPRSE